DNAGRTLYSAQVIPSEGAWIEFDVGSNNVIYVKVGQTRKFPASTLLRAFHYFDEAEPRQAEATTVKPSSVADLVGRLLAERVVDMSTGEILSEGGHNITEALAERMVAAENLTPIKVIDARRPCATTRDLLDIFGREVRLHQPLVLTEELTSPRGLEPFELPVGSPIDAGFVQRLDRWRLIQRVPPTRLMVKVRRGEHGEVHELSLKDLQKDIKDNPPLTRDNLVGKRLVGDLMFEGEASPVVRAYERITPNIAELIVSNRIDELAAIEVDEAIERTLEEDSVPESLDETAETNEKVVLESLYRTLRPGDPPSIESGRSLLRSMFFDPRRYDLARVGRYKINRKLQTRDRLGVEVPLDIRWLTKADLIAILKYLISLRGGTEGFTTDDIDNLENKRVRAVGELLQNQLRLGFLRMERVARERMTSSDPETVTAQQIISIKPITAAIKSFFGSGALSQFMDQTNPLAELAHKRRVSSMGPGGLSRQSAKLEVRDVHRSHYGRLCPIMTPEGPNIGLISALAIFARLNEFGFLETPYRKVKEGQPTDNLAWLTADAETTLLAEKRRPPTIAAAADWHDDSKEWKSSRIICRRAPTQFPSVEPVEVDYIDVSPKQIFSAATALIPFLENDDANRALMGSNMMRQAVPLVRTEAPWVGTGIERQVAVDSGAVICAGRDGVVTTVDGRRITITGYDGSVENHDLLSFERTNQATFMNQSPIVALGQHVRGPRAEDGTAIQIGPYDQLPDGATPGDPIADGSCTDFGRLSLGKNVVVAFMSWEGYNYEDAIILSKRMVRDDIFTSVHIDKYEIQARDTKLGPEEITADIPNISDELRNNLDERGIIKIGTVVRPEDILVGKVAPKGQSEMTAEEKLVIAIFGKKAEEMRDTSLRVPHGAKGKVVAVRVFSRFKHRCSNCHHLHEFSKSAELAVCENCGSRDTQREPADDLPAGVNQLVRVYVAQRRKIMEGDKMAGRHGNKGVISKILPMENMPFLPDGTPVDVILNPLGVPSRMNIGQILETHLGWVAYHRGEAFETPVFASIPEEQIFTWLQEVYEAERERVLVDYLRSELPIWRDREQPLAGSEELLASLEAELLETDEGEVISQGERLGLDPELLLELAAEKRVRAVVDQVIATAERRVGFDPSSGKMVLRDGRTGQSFDRDVMVGIMYVMKLSHLVDDKIHARSTGPYSLVTQQPLGGKAQFGGQRFGEMEVWALEAYGSAHSLQEVLTIKSDDVHGRVKAYESIVKGENIQDPGIPESFKILIKELQSLGLEVTVESKEGRAVDLNDTEE
ncbi:MAG: DNA-directed RNA polymerase subunit beta, partial [Armatimonadetes bacterium]|nr:DNA-directed RNA polymerase subunit beta [Armatimonadota bacterium]